jgi:hypothetical protein
MPRAEKKNLYTRVDFAEACAVFQSRTGSLNHRRGVTDMATKKKKAAKGKAKAKPKTKAKAKPKIRIKGRRGAGPPNPPPL